MDFLKIRAPGRYQRTPAVLFLATRRYTLNAYVRRENIPRSPVCATGAGFGLGGRGIAPSRFRPGSLQPMQTQSRLPVTAAIAVESPSSLAPTAADLGYSRGLLSEFAYENQQPLGHGGNGTVRLVRELATGKLFACKSIPKVPAPGVSDLKRAQHLNSIRREAEVLQRLRMCLNVVELRGVFEDDSAVHLVMTHCSGGELWRAGQHYSERTVASFMRAVLRTIAQCHSHHILHRDIKPGNFLFLDTSARSPVLAIDFGLAMPYDPEQLPRSDLGLEGTPWFMAPETLVGRVGPPSDVWSAGVTAYQLLSGRVPFDDKSNPRAPAVATIWRAILSDPPEFKGPAWSRISPEAKDFITALLHKDPARRPTAMEALQHPWLQGRADQRGTGRALASSVVRRLQRWGQTSPFKQAVLKSMAAKLLATSDTMGCHIEWADAKEQQRHQLEGGAVAEGPPVSVPPAPAPAAAGPAPPPAPSPAPLLDVSLLPQGCAALSTPGAAGIHELHRLTGTPGGGDVSQEALASAISALGLRLREGDVRRLVSQLTADSSGQVDRALLIASQLDWQDLQEEEEQEDEGEAEDTAGRDVDNGEHSPDSVAAVAATSAGTSGQEQHRRQHEGATAATDLWHTLARQAFMSLDSDRDGLLQPMDILRVIQESEAAAAASRPPGDSSVHSGSLHHSNGRSRPGPADVSVRGASASVHGDAPVSPVVAGEDAGAAEVTVGATSTDGLLLPRTPPAFAALANELGSAGEALVAGGGVDFEGFLQLLRAHSVDNLELYDGRSTISSTSSEDGTNHSRMSLLSSEMGTVHDGEGDGHGTSFLEQARGKRMAAGLQPVGATAGTATPATSTTPASHPIVFRFGGCGRERGVGSAVGDSLGVADGSHNGTVSGAASSVVSPPGVVVRETMRVPSGPVDGVVHGGHLYVNAALAASRSRVLTPAGGSAGVKG